MANPGDLPPDILNLILQFLDGPGLRAMASTCRGMRARSQWIAPGLHLSLHPHQRNALAWMRARERPPQLLSDPTQREIVSSRGASYWVDELTGRVSSERPRPASDARGGMFCDEPGLGKTITMLALLLATQGLYAEPPEARSATGPVARCFPCLPFYASRKHSL